MDMRTNSYFRTLFLFLTLLTSETGKVCAQATSLTQSDILIQVLPSGKEGEGSVTATEGSITASVSGQVVTLTVTPTSGYKIKKDLIVVEKMINPSNLANSRRRAPGVGTITVSGSSEWVTSENSYTFTVPSN